MEKLPWVEFEVANWLKKRTRCQVVFQENLAATSWIQIGIDLKQKLFCMFCSSVSTQGLCSSGSEFGDASQAILHLLFSDTCCAGPMLFGHPVELLGKPGRPNQPAESLFGHC